MGKMTARRVMIILLGMIAAVSGWTIPARARDLSAIPAKMRCEDLTDRIFTVDASVARITAATTQSSPPAAKSTSKTETVPTCHVTGYVAPQIQFDLRLPLSDWHQRLLFQGCGGFCGSVETRSWAASNCQALDRGEFAAVTSDLGHKGSRADGVWAVGNPQGLQDFGSRGVHLVLLTTQKIISAFYGQSPRYSYFSGCSDGGREALMAAQRFPRDFDGILAGAPALNLTANNSIYHAWTAQHLLTRDGKPLLDEAHLRLVNEEVLRQCDAKDGSRDGVIAEPLTCHPVLDSLLCNPGREATCLTPDQVAAVLAIYTGPISPSGRRLYHGAPVGSENYWNQAAGSVQFARNFVSFMTGSDRPVPLDVWDFDYTDASLRRYDRYASILNATDTNLEPFRTNGGKMLMWHGWEDNSIPPTSTTDYVKAVRQRMGADKAGTFLRLFMVPGMTHCTGNNGPYLVNFLEPLMRWVEDGIAPDEVGANWADASKPQWILRPYIPR